MGCNTGIGRRRCGEEVPRALHVKRQLKRTNIQLRGAALTTSLGLVGRGKVESGPVRRRFLRSGLSGKEKSPYRASERFVLEGRSGTGHSKTIGI